MRLSIFLLSTLLLTGCTLTIGAGSAYVNSIPKTHLTGHTQFIFSVEHSAKILESTEIVTAYTHYSNGAQLGIGDDPNFGLDFVSTQVKYTFTTCPVLPLF